MSYKFFITTSGGRWGSTFYTLHSTTGVVKSGDNMDELQVFIRNNINNYPSSNQIYDMAKTEQRELAYSGWDIIRVYLVNSNGIITDELPLI